MQNTIHSLLDGKEHIHTVHKDNLAKTIKILQNKKHENIKVIK